MNLFFVFNIRHMLMHKYVELKQLVRDIEPDIERLTYHYSYEAGTRVRWKMQEIRSLCKDIREKIQLQREHERNIKNQNKK